MQQNKKNKTMMKKRQYALTEKFINVLVLSIRFINR